MKPKIVISINTAWNIFNFRSGLIKSLISQGYDVIAVAPNDEYSDRIKELGCKFINLHMDKNGSHPGRDLILLLRYFLILKNEKPHAFLGYTVKPNVYGSMAAQLLRIPVINNIAGLGATFIHTSFLTRIVRSLYKFALYRSHRVFFQNTDDQEMFIQAGLVRSEITDRVPGSGINMVHYQSALPISLFSRSFRFLLVARMLKDKGVNEFVDAARTVRQRFPETEFQLLGFVDAENANAISARQIKEWEDEGLIRYMGKTDDVRPYLSAADCVVLPSYREGVPRSLLEAAAMARPIITTDTVGCRDVVDDQVNGFLCRVKDANDLAEKMIAMVELCPEDRLKMGEAGKQKVKTEFDEKVVIQKYLEVIGEVLNSEIAMKKNKKMALTPDGK
ncbi:glycosyltransferase family 4 protein [Glaciimonas sp. PCH181]|uniref:glycosyltransferase family 4 protein n=1 Tax=Glaciimonas sp. PCH181 TaxID=2133943 RepID=UPI000D35001E|nr:glycosyltransferase family 4 protein [Glaciimonas sp. PCH181]PUA16910.1 glycosyltransferase family 1 protein [Glaciimonas sp. PCH181]